MKSYLLPDLSAQMFYELTCAKGSALAYVITYRSSPVVRPSTPLNDFSSETLGQFCSYSSNGELKICTNDHGPLIKMVAMPIYCKNNLKYFSPEQALRLNLGIKHRGLKVYVSRLFK